VSQSGLSRLPLLAPGCILFFLCNRAMPGLWQKKKKKKKETAS
jgi:hypothetical protein